MEERIEIFPSDIAYWMTTSPNQNQRQAVKLKGLDNWEEPRCQNNGISKNMKKINQKKKVSKKGLEGKHVAGTKDDFIYIPCHRINYI